MSTEGTATVHVRPVVDREEVAALVDVQELLLELASEDGPTRVVEVGRKRLPDAGSDSPNWGYVRLATDDPDALDDLLGDDTYRTATQGERHQSATRVAARGTWRLRREASSTLLDLELEGELDDDLLGQLHLVPRASYAMTVKNPRAAGDAGLDEDERADLPDDLQAVFDGNRWAPVDPVELLDHPGVEFVLVAGE